MDNDTINRLNQLNQAFYRVTASDFNESRNHAWPGWAPLLPHLQHITPSPLRVLDVGCGNGRFGVFLKQHLDIGIAYHGMDSDPTLLEHAIVALEAAGITANLAVRDIIQEPPDAGAYDLVVLFGVLHHVPGAAQRLGLMRQLAQRVAPGGFLAFAGWRFYEYERFRERILPWPDDLQAETHDYLLDWRRGANAVRYCHYVDDAEHQALIVATGLTEVTSYRADGKTNDMNRYSILKR